MLKKHINNMFLGAHYNQFCFSNNKYLDLLSPLSTLTSILFSYKHYTHKTSPYMIYDISLCLAQLS